MAEPRNAQNAAEFAKKEQAAIMEAVKAARKERGISQRRLGELSGVQQPVIVRMEKGDTSPQVETVLKVLHPLDKKLAVVPQDKGGDAQ